MAKIVIETKGENLHESVIRNRLSLLLASTLSSLSSVHVSLRPKTNMLDSTVNYRCEVEGVYPNAKRFMAASEHPRAMVAIESAAQRLRRSIVRDRRFS